LGRIGQFQFIALELQQQLSSVSDLLLQKGHIKQSEEIKGVKISVHWETGSDPTVSSTAISPTGNSQIDTGIQQMINGYNLHSAGCSSRICELSPMKI
jgi:hypothetical protein